MIEKYNWITEKANSLNGTDITFKEEWKAHVFKIADKMYAFIGHDNEGRDILNIKGLPEANEELRTFYKSIIPGYYSNKVHWNSILLTNDDAPENNVVLDLLKESYDLVFSKLTKKVRDEIEGK
ncbi:MmcQ/YjbR family DNA-binding protein [Metaclostridioides mangenotii]|uniref:MmcQ/YjbR family DNA-binding protein n=1 Tax=Metaclostridioides mangenotii TaxID=1540 RepID=UPI000466204A|nr:MmcQ/YjbR family DNA-binding protein [Clostridioides mangenotii]